MELKTEINSIIEDINRNTVLTSENKEYLITLLEDLLFKYNSVQYHRKNLLSKKGILEKQSEIQCEKHKNNLKNMKEFWTDEKINTKETCCEIKFVEEIDSSEVFYEFESLTFEIISFIDYGIRLIKVFYPHLSGSKSKILKAFEKRYPESPFYSIFKTHFKKWIAELINYRDYVCHLSCINSHICSVVDYESGYQKIEKKGNEIHATLRAPHLDTTTRPIYLPIKPDYRHKIISKIEDKEINYEDDFYTLENYIDKVITNFLIFVKEYTSQVSKEVKLNGNKRTY